MSIINEYLTHFVISFKSYRYIDAVNINRDLLNEICSVTCFVFLAFIKKKKLLGKLKNGKFPQSFS